MKIRLAAELRQKPLGGGSYALPHTPARNRGGLIIREEREGEGPTKADGRENKMAIVS